MRSFEQTQTQINLNGRDGQNVQAAPCWYYQKAPRINLGLEKASVGKNRRWYRKEIRRSLVTWGKAPNHKRRTLVNGWVKVVGKGTEIVGDCIQKTGYPNTEVRVCQRRNWWAMLNLDRASFDV